MDCMWAAIAYYNPKANGRGPYMRWVEPFNVIFINESGEKLQHILEGQLDYFQKLKEEKIKDQKKSREEQLSMFKKKQSIKEEDII